MQQKHAWDKLTVLSGNVECDFKNIISILEEHQIADKQFLKESVFFPEESSIKKIIRSDHVAQINQQHVQAVFETYIETGETYLKDAWVISKK
jgi:gamma-glutamyl-gamma-aminobutyrate hydrolase PuuD